MTKRRWIKRALLGLALLLSVVAGAGYWLFQGTPDWYAPQRMSRADMLAAADSAERTAVRAQEWAKSLTAGEQRALASGTGRAAATQPADSYTIRFTESELNALFTKWDAWYGWRQRYEGHVQDPAIVLRDDRLILAARMRDIGAVASFHFEPVLDGEGQFLIDLVRVQAGRLPMPDAVWHGQRDRIVDLLRARLPGWRREARIAPNGAANGDAIKAGAAQLLLQILSDEPADAVLFLPTIGGAGAVPVRLTNVEIDDEAMSLTVESMTPAEREALLDRLRNPGPDGVATASTH